MSKLSNLRDQYTGKLGLLNQVAQAALDQAPMQALAEILEQKGLLTHLTKYMIRVKKMGSEPVMAAMVAPSLFYAEGYLCDGVTNGDIRNPLKNYLPYEFQREFDLRTESPFMSREDNKEIADLILRCIIESQDKEEEIHLAPGWCLVRYLTSGSQQEALIEGNIDHIRHTVSIRLPEGANLTEIISDKVRYGFN